MIDVWHCYNYKYELDAEYVRGLNMLGLHKDSNEILKNRYLTGILF